MSLHQSLFIRTIADNMKAAQFSKDWIGRTRGPIKGIITDVLDPLNEGRVKVVLDSKNGETQFQSDWIPFMEPFVGKLPETLIGSRVNINPTDSDMQRMVVTGVINDEKSESQPANTNMTRMPTYPAGKLPPPCKENVGCTVIEEEGPYGWDTLCVCLGKKEGDAKKYYWIRLPHLDHIHAGADDSPKYQEFLGGAVLPGEWSEQKVVWDHVVPTSDKEYEKEMKTNYGVNGRGTQADFNGPAPYEELE